ncbi:MAG: type II 3-dehydroquinate dehydratase [Kiritimatiellae bacterium]|nr:type II 3-dehydroquinate dehydratase [Kiritimatiellia bacterium]
MIKILVLNGPNLNMLGKREPALYGAETLDSIIQGLRKLAGTLGVELEHMQSNEEGVLVSQIQAGREKFDGIILNPAAFTHTSVALRDALQSVTVPCVEVHLTNTSAREEFRHVSLTAGACLGQIMGFGAMGYHLALTGLVQYLKSGRGPGINQ